MQQSDFIEIERVDFDGGEDSLLPAAPKRRRRRRLYSARVIIPGVGELTSIPVSSLQQAQHSHTRLLDYVRNREIKFHSERLARAYETFCKNKKNPRKVLEELQIMGYTKSSAYTMICSFRKY